MTPAEYGLTKLANKNNIINLLSLATIQASNIIFSLVAFPFILSAYGENKFSVIVITESVALIILTIVLYGFDIIAIEKATLLIKKNKEYQISKLHYNVVQLRFLLLFTSLIFLLPIAYLYNKEIGLVYLSWVLFISGHILHSSWFFQVKNKNLYPSIITLLSRLLFLIAILTLINNELDYKLSVLLIGCSYFFSGTGCMLYSILLLKKRPRLVSKKSGIQLLLSGKEVVTGNLFVTLFRGSNTLILSFFANDLAVSIYALAEKIIKGIQAMVRPINELMYPIFLRATNIDMDRKSYLKILMKFSAPQLIFSIINITLLILLFDIIAKAINVGDSKQLLTLILIMSPAVLFGIMNSMFGSAGLNYIGKKAEFARMIIITGIITFVLSIGLIFLYKQHGAATSYLLGELLLFYQIITEYKKEDN